MSQADWHFADLEAVFAAEVFAASEGKRAWPLS
jgi:hypothetical protein